MPARPLSFPLTIEDRSPESFAHPFPSVGSSMKKSSASIGNFTRTSRPGLRSLVMLTASLMLSARTVALDNVTPSPISIETFIIRPLPSSHRGCSLSLLPGGRSRHTPRPRPAAEVPESSETRAHLHPPQGRECSHPAACQRLPAAGRVASRVGNGCRRALPELRRLLF